MATGRKVVSVSALLTAAFGPAIGFAQAPLNIDALMVERSQLTLQVGGSFLSAQNNVPIPLSVDAGAPAFGQLPAQAIAEQDIESDQWLSALRYGAGSAVELRTTIRQRESRIRLPYQTTSSRRSAALAVGGTWQVSRDHETPALLLSIDVDVAARSPLQDSQVGYGKAVRLNALTYRSLDPVVLSLQLGIEHQSRWQTGELTFDPGDSASVKTQVSFAVNPQVTLISGVGLQVSEPSRVSDIELGKREKRIGLNMAAGLALSRRSSIFLGTEISANGSRAASINIEWLYQFDL